MKERHYPKLGNHWSAFQNGAMIPIRWSMPSESLHLLYADPTQHTLWNPSRGSHMRSFENDQGQVGKFHKKFEGFENAPSSPN